MIFVRASVGVSTDGRHSTPGNFSSAEYNNFLRDINYDLPLMDFLLKQKPRPKIG